MTAAMPAPGAEPAPVMRVLHLLNHVQDVGNGIVNVTIDLACAQSMAGDTVAVASSGGDFEPLLREYGIEHHVVPQRRSALILPGGLLTLSRLLRQWRPQIVHCHMMTGVVLARLLSGVTEGVIFATVHNEFQRSASLMALADEVIAISAAVRRRMLARGLDPRRVHVVHNGTLDGPRRRRDGATGNSIVLSRPCVVTVAGMNDRKGIPVLLRAFDRVAGRHGGVHLYLVGDGPERRRYEALAAASPHRARIHFEGFRPDAQNYLKQADVFVLASLREPFGLAIGEAREAGTAIIASDVDGIPEALDFGACGMLVPPGDAAALAAQIGSLLESPEALSCWKERARQNLAWLSVERMASETRRLYEAALCQRHR